MILTEVLSCRVLYRCKPDSFLLYGVFPGYSVYLGNSTDDTQFLLPDLLSGIHYSCEFTDDLPPEPDVPVSVLYANNCDQRAITRSGDLPVLQPGKPDCFSGRFAGFQKDTNKVCAISVKAVDGNGRSDRSKQCKHEFSHQR